MSYCRWSSDNWMCDVYVYESAEGYKCHVAASRLPQGSIPPVTANMFTEPDTWRQEQLERLDALDRVESQPIGLKHDGESFTVPSPGECGDLLERLRVEGYNVPQFAIDALREEGATPSS